MAETSATTSSTTLPVLPLPGGVVFPGTVVTLHLETDAARQAVGGARAGDGRVLLVPELDGRSARVGTIAHVEQVGELPVGGTAAILRGEQRARVGAGVISERAGLWVEAELVSDPSPTPRVDAAHRDLRAVATVVAERRRSRRLPEILRTVHEAGALADAIAGWSDDPAELKVAVLEAVDVGDRVEQVTLQLKEMLAELEVTDKIRNDVSENLENAQREHLLRQQMAAIRKELGEDGDDPAAEYRAKAAELPLPEKVAKAVNDEIDRLERAGGQGPEQGWIRTWLDRVLALPWGTTTTDSLDLGGARDVLDADHTGLDDVKERIVEYLAVRKLRAERGLDATPDDGVAPSARRGGGAILALVGPPGVGKTSLGESVARAMGRKFVRLALGGVRDEAEIRGHRRTYVGSQPGRIVRAITEAETMNPVVLLDEVDKLQVGGWSGDPASALLEVLDPAQNHTFRDHYLEVDLDLSDVVFLATANTAETIPGPLLDRMDVIRLDGYTEEEKVFIARDHLMPRLLDRAGLRADEVVVDESAIRTVINGYTREAGVRSLERELGRLLRKVATKVASGAETPIIVDDTGVTPLIGRVKVQPEDTRRADVPGVATGLAVTGVGGDVLFIEVSASPGEAALVLTGQLGDVMKESAQIALSWVRANAARLGIDPAALDRRFHVHVPAGAVPKDGPSAGVTITSALVSFLTGRLVRPEIGMTGEVTLAGRVLPIGGVKQKVLAAHRMGLTTVVLPERNGPDMEDVPEAVRDQLTIHLASTVEQVLDVALAPAGAAAEAPPAVAAA